ncbi:MAG: hypothetical protein C4334_02745 [Pyrinomonas sp.]
MKFFDKLKRRAAFPTAFAEGAQRPDDEVRGAFSIADNLLAKRFGARALRWRGNRGARSGWRKFCLKWIFVASRQRVRFGRRFVA